MRQTTYRNLRGACDAVITGETAEAMGAASKQDVMQMLQAGDAAHMLFRRAAGCGRRTHGVGGVYKATCVFVRSGLE